MRSWIIVAGVGVIAGTLGFVGVASAQCQVLKRTGPVAPGFDDFGTIIAGGGSRYVVVSDISNTQPGSQAWVYRREGTSLVSEGQLVTRQPTPSGGMENFYTTSAATDGDTILLGSKFFHIWEGRVMVFTRTGTTWSQTALLSAPPSGEPNVEFGTSVAVDGDTMAVAAGYTGIGNQDVVGAVYVYRRQAGTWTLSQTINNPFSDVFTSSAFGAAMSLKNGRLVFSAAGGADPFDPGYVYIYNDGPGGFTYEATLTATLADDFVDGFGAAFAIDGDLCVVGAPQEGAIYAFRKGPGGWARTARVGYPWRPAPGPSRFGCTLFVRDGGAGGQDLIVVGDYESGKYASEAGAVTVFHGTPSSGSAQYFGPLDLTNVHRFSRGMAADSTGALLIGAPGGNAAYLYGGFDADCDNNGVTNLCELASGAADADGDGVPDGCQTTGFCPADFNHQGGVELLDIFAFLEAWFAGNIAADFNQQGGVELLDIFAFLEAWFMGPC